MVEFCAHCVSLSDTLAVPATDSVYTLAPIIVNRYLYLSLFNKLQQPQLEEVGTKIRNVLAHFNYLDSTQLNLKPQQTVSGIFV